MSDHPHRHPRPTRFGRRAFLAGAAGLTGTALTSSLARTANAAGRIAGAARDDVGVLGAPDQVGRYERFEMTGDGLPVVTNPFDPAQIDVRAHCVDPFGFEREVPAFWFQDFIRHVDDFGERLDPSGSPQWKARFTPDLEGTWTWWWTVRTPDDEHTGERRRLTVTANGLPGFIRRSERDVRYLVRDGSGEPYFPIGENVCWSGETVRWPSTADYDRWFPELGEQRANYARLWMATWGFALEWDDTPLGDYSNRLDRAWALDYVVDLAAANGLALMLCLNNHGPFSTTHNSEWEWNPYNAANGGPLATPTELFTDPAAIQLFQRRYRYVVARWGYATNMLAWELWNEVDFTDGYDDDLSAAWHRDMAAYLRSIDPFGHLVTTSYSYPAPFEIVDGADLDLVQLHFYAGGEALRDDVSIATTVGELAGSLPEDYQRPFLPAEIGVSFASWEENDRLDPEGLGLREMLWAPALSGACGTGMTWWWEYIGTDPNRFYPEFGSIARFLDGVRWDREQFAATTATATSPAKPLTVFGLDGADTELLWVKNEAHRLGSYDHDQVVDGVLTVPAIGADWTGSWWDTSAGESAGEAVLTDGPDGVTAAIPPFVGGIALRLSRS